MNNITLQVGVKALLKNQQGKYLILKRSSKKYPEVIELWDIVGGRIDPGTPLIENLKREIEEETKLQLKDTPVLIYAQDILRIKGRHVVRLTYTADIEGEPQIDPEETAEYKWVTLQEIREQEAMDSHFMEVLNSGKILA